MNKVLPARKKDIAKKMFDSRKVNKTPPFQPRAKKIDFVYGKRGSPAPAGANLTFRRNKNFSKDSSNASYSGKDKKVAGGWQNK